MREKEPPLRYMAVEGYLDKEIGDPVKVNGFNYTVTGRIHRGRKLKTRRELGYSYGQGEARFD